MRWWVNTGWIDQTWTIRSAFCLFFFSFHFMSISSRKLLPWKPVYNIHNIVLREFTVLWNSIPALILIFCIFFTLVWFRSSNISQFIHYLAGAEQILCHSTLWLRWCCVRLKKKVLFPNVSTFCSKRVRSRVWREVCGLCFSQTEPGFELDIILPKVSTL